MSIQSYLQDYAPFLTLPESDYWDLALPVALAFLLGVLVGAIFRCCSRRSTSDIKAQRIVAAQDQYEKMQVQEEILRNSILIQERRLHLYKNLNRLLWALMFILAVLWFFAAQGLNNSLLLTAGIALVFTSLLQGFKTLSRTKIDSNREQLLTLNDRLSKASQILLDALPKGMRRMIEEAVRVDLKQEEMQKQNQSPGCTLKCQLLLEKTVMDLQRHEKVLSEMTGNFNWCPYCVEEAPLNNAPEGKCSEDCGRRFIRFTTQVTQKFIKEAEDLRPLQKEIERIIDEEQKEIEKEKAQVEKKRKLRKLERELAVKRAQNTLADIRKLKAE